MSDLDHRLHAYRQDLADARLKADVEAARYVEGRPGQTAVGVAPLRRAPANDAPLMTEILFGEDVVVFENRDGWLWVQSELDGYVGYAPATSVRDQRFAPTHQVSALRSFLYPVPDMKAPPLDCLTQTTTVRVEEADEKFSRLAGGTWVYSKHLDPVGTVATDPLAEARRYMGVPYLWGGRSSLGLDCSALIQLVLASCGLAAPRDTDMQQRAIGEPVAFDGNASGLRTGDLVYWPDHVGIFQAPDRIVHANATDMQVSDWDLAELIAHVRRLDGNDVSAVRRPAWQT